LNTTKPQRFRQTRKDSLCFCGDLAALRYQEWVEREKNYFLSVDEIVATPIEKLLNFITKQDKNRLKELEKIAESINKAAREFSKNRRQM